MILKGYVSSRPLNDDVSVDQSVQNLVIKNSCQKRGFNYSFSAIEYGMKNCFLVLNQILQDLKNNKKYEGIAFYSLLQLPNNFEIRERIYKNSIFKGKIIFFSLENILINKKKDIIKLEEIIKIQYLLKYTPKNIYYN